MSSSPFAVTHSPPRALCPQCARAQLACICSLAHTIAHRTQVLVLQHPLEVQHPKGTARLLHLCLPHSRLVVGENWNATDLYEWLHGAWPANAADALPSLCAEAAPDLTLLLYPPSPPDPALPLQPPPPYSAQELQRVPAYATVRLVVIDGTWRKSRKMLYANPLLQQLPRMPLQEVPQGHYVIRKAHKPGQLSTLEACCAALQQLEPQNPNTAQLLVCMHALQQHYAQFCPSPSSRR